VRNFKGVAQRDQRRVLGSCGKNTAAKYWSDNPAQWNGPGSVPLPLIFLIARRSTLSSYWYTIWPSAYCGTGHVRAEPAGHIGNAVTGAPFTSTAVCTPTT
jgi:hypothetical protein